jgi:hypothetical protein
MDALLVSLLLALLSALALYWIVRLAVHHGTLDADASRRTAERHADPDGRTSLRATVRDSQQAVPDPDDRS